MEIVVHHSYSNQILVIITIGSPPFNILRVVLNNHDKLFKRLKHWFVSSIIFSVTYTNIMVVNLSHKYLLIKMSLMLIL